MGRDPLYRETMTRRAAFAIGLATSALCGALASAQQPTRISTGADNSHTKQSLRLYLSPIRVDSGYRLTPNGYSGATHVQQTVDFSDRRDSARVAPVVGATTRAIETWNGVQFVSPKLAGPFELSGFFSGQLEFITNKASFDFQISLYELTATGDYVLVSAYSTQDSSTHNSQITPLQTGTRQHIDYQSSRLPAREIHNGSQLVVLVTILRQPSKSDELTEPLEISWYGESYIELHVGRE